MKTKRASHFLRSYYDEKKRLIEVIGFVGVIASLFLQITQFQNDSLKMVQAILLLIFSVLLSYLLLNFFLRSIAYKKETPKSIAFNSMLFSLSVGVFIFNLSKFLYISFGDQLVIILQWSKIGLFFLMWLYFTDITRFFSKKFGKEKLWIAMNEAFFVVLSYFFFIYKKGQVELKSLIIPALLVLINIPLAYKWIRRQTFNWLFAVVVIIYIWLYIL